jgi:uncharacterized protein (DUF1778 family)
MSTLNQKRITTRFPDQVLSKAQTAAELVVGSVNQFITQAALEKAEKVIQEESTIFLTGRESMCIL